jgi:hypothetical protein
VRIAVRQPVAQKIDREQMANLSLRNHRRQRGQSIVEFALVAPIMIFLMFGILDLARIWTTMMSVESAAREAADFGTFYGAEKWQAGATDPGGTVEQMELRACVAASDLPDFRWDDENGDGVVDLGEPCENPTFDWCLTWDVSNPCDKAYPVDPDPQKCDDRLRDPPCTVTVTMSHDFALFVPFNIDFFGVKLGLPASLSFDRDSTFAMTDIDVDD